MAGTLDAATGKRSSYARGFEKANLGQPQGTLKFLKFISIDSRRDAKWNKSAAISASEGEDKGTPGEITLEGKPKYDLTAFQLAVGLAGMVGAPTITVLTATKSWLLQFFPSRVNALRGIWEYLFRGSAEVGAISTSGRRVSKIGIDYDANKRGVVTEELTDGLGDSISGLPVAKTGNLGTYTGRISSRGRRPHDANWTASPKKSFYLKVTAKSASQVTFQAKYDTASPGDGSGFPAGAYDAATFQVKPPDTATNHDGYTTAKLDAGPVGIFGEDFQPFQITAEGNLDTFAVGDEFEIPALAKEVAFVNIQETRLSAFHFDLTLGGTRLIKTTKCAVELNRPYNDYKANRSRYAIAIDPTGNAMGSLKFDQRFFDNYLRDLQDGNERFTVYARTASDLPIPTTPDFEGVELWIPQAAIEALDEGGISTPNVLTSSATVNAENPDSPIAGPGAYFPGTRPWQVNITTGIDPTTFF